MPAVMYPTDAYGNIATLAGPQTFTATKTFLAGSAASVPVIVRGAASQTGDLMQFLLPDGTVNARMNNNGNLILAANTVTTSSYLRIGIAAAGAVGSVIRAAASQTANLSEWQNSGGTMLTGVAPAGHVHGHAGSYIFQPDAASPNAFIAAGAAGQRAIVVRGAASQTANLAEFQNSAGTVMVSIGGNNGYANFQRGYFTSDITNGLVLGVQGASGQTNNLQEWRNSANTALSYIDSGGRFVGLKSAAFFGDTARGSALYVQSGATTQPNTVLQGVASQTANLQEWQGADATATLRVTAERRLQYGPGTAFHGSAAVGIVSNDPTLSGIRIRGATGQSANLQEWQDAAGTVALAVDGSTQRLNFGGSNLRNGPVGPIVGYIDIIVGGTTRCIPYYATN